MKLKLITISFLGASLVACGGGGGGGGGDGGGGGGSTAPYQLTARINGVDVPNFTVKPGESKVLGITTGQEVEIIASAPSVTLKSDDGLATSQVIASTNTNYRARYTTAQHTIVQRVFAQQSSPANVAGVTLTVRGTDPNFARVIPKVGDTFTYSEKDNTLANTEVNFPLSAHVVTAVTANGWNENFVNPGNVVMSRVNFNLDGNRVAYQADPTNDPAGCRDARFDPAERLLQFPLQEGKVYEPTSWITTCGSDRQVESFTATVGKYEPITTAGGTFNALRIETKTVVTQSTDTRLPGRGYEQNITVWFDPILGRNVKYSGRRSYPLGEPTAEREKFLTQTNIDLVNVIKN